MSKIKKVLYDDFNGIYERLRSGDYTISAEEKQIILDFSNEINEDLKNNKLTPERAAIAIDLVHSLGQFRKQDWPENLAVEAYVNMLRGFDFIY